MRTLPVAAATSAPSDAASAEPAALRHGIRRGGYLVIAHAYGGLAETTVVDYRLASGVVHHAWNPCINTGDDRVATVATVLADLDAGTVTAVCSCFTTLLDASGAPASLIDWAHDLLCAPAYPDTPSGHVHRSRYLRGLPVVVAERHAAFTDRVHAEAVVEEARLTGTDAYRRELVAAAAATTARAPWLPPGHDPGNRWHPALPAWEFRPDDTVEEVFSALVNGPQMWYLADDDEYATLGYRYATDYDPAYRGVARAPLAFAGLLEHALGERYLGLDLGYPVDQVAWAAARSRGPRDFHDTLTALRIAAAC